MKLRYVSTPVYASVLGVLGAFAIYNDKDLKPKIWQAALFGALVGGVAFVTTQYGGIGSHSAEEIIVGK